MSFFSVSKNSMARSLDAVSSFIQHSMVVLVLLCIMGAAAFAFDGLAGKERQEGLLFAPIALGAVFDQKETTKVEAVDDLPLPLPELKPQFSGALDYIKRRYRVSPDAVLPVFEVAQLVGKERRIDPLLILAIIGVESGFNPFAESHMGARGLMQVIPRFHMDKMPEGSGSHQLFDPAVNIQVGVLVLEEAIRRRGGLVAGLQSYSGSSDAVGSYSSKVLAEKARLERAVQAARRDIAVEAASNA